MKIYKRYENSTIDNYEITTDVQKRLIETLKNGIVNGFEKNVVIVGGVGTGKTHLALAIYKHFAKVEDREDYKTGQVKQVVVDGIAKYTTIKEIIHDIRSCWNKEADAFDRQRVQTLKTKPLLIIDEIGVQYGTDSERIELFDIINDRYNEMLPTIVVSNLDKENITKLLGQRISDRIFGGADVFELTGKSWR